MTPSRKRFILEFGSAMLILYPLTIWLSQWWGAHAPPPSPWRWLLALPPIAPCLWALVAIVRFVRSLDELQRRIKLEGAVYSVVITGLYLVSYSFLQGVMHWPRPEPFATFCVLMGSWAVGVFWGRWRYR